MTGCYRMHRYRLSHSSVKRRHQWTLQETLDAQETTTTTVHEGSLRNIANSRITDIAPQVVIEVVTAAAAAAAAATAAVRVGLEDLTATAATTISQVATVVVNLGAAIRAVTSGTVATGRIRNANQSTLSQTAASR